MAQDDYSADIAELVQLKGLATRPNVVHELERLIEAYQGKQNNSLRQPMQISKVNCVQLDKGGEEDAFIHIEW